ncbi:DNA-processing protein DprA [Microbacterium sp. KR10-403]|uniref:DNA-processing protein DprA n=1 Tax=Microbacterium sp. KR10-403 TaxID=3158581 RepID=UPI0032E48D1B
MTAFRWDDTAAQIVAELADTSEPAGDRLARRYATAVWSYLVEPGDGVAGALVGALGADSALHEVLAGARDGIAADAAGLTAAELRAGISRWKPRLQAEEIAFALARARDVGARLVTPDDDCWPRALRDLGAHAPLCLWVRGDSGRLAKLEPAIAIVGARAATGYGEHLAGEFAAELAGRGIAVISGGAYGIDGAAHRGALAADGLTAALVAGGVDKPYPTGHADLLRRIASSGVVASEVPCGSVPSKWRFLQRNRLIAALGGATVVVEAGWRSGSLNTASHASQLGRPLAAVPGPVTSGASAGCHRILREYQAQCVTTADEVCELIGLSNAAQVETGTRTDDRTRVVDALSSRSWRDVDDVARRSGMAPEDVRTHLGLLALDGTAEAQGGGWRRVAARAAG